MRLAVENTATHRGWDACSIATDGRVLLQAWNYEKADRFSLGGKAITLPYFEQRGVHACGTRFVFVGHPWEDGKPAQVVILDGKQRHVCDLPRTGHEHHFLGSWLDGDLLTVVASDPFHVVHGIGITTFDVRGKRAKQTPIKRVLQLTRHIGKGHAELSLQSVLRRGDQLFALASAGYRYYALLALEPKAKSYGSRVLAHMKADQAMFAATGEHAVFYERGKSAVIVGLDGAKLATCKPPVAKGSYLTAATPGFLAFSAKKQITVLTTAPWPRGDLAGELADIPNSAPIADLPIAAAATCSPEPVSYRGGAPVAFAALTGWYLDADPVKKKPVITHAIITDLIVNFFATTNGKLRLLFNFDLSAIDDVTVEGQRVTITTPSGTTILMAPRAFAKALIRSTQ